MELFKKGGEIMNNVVNEVKVNEEQSVKAICIRQIEALDKAKKTVKLHNEQVKSVLEGDNDYCELDKQIKDLQASRRLRKSEVLSTKSNSMVALKLKDAKEEVSDLKDSLGVMLEEYKNQSGVDSIETEKGTYQIKSVYQLKLI